MTPAWFTVGAGARGPGHRLSGTGCEDAFAVWTHGDALAIALADGVGSAAYGARGAACAVAAALKGARTEVEAGTAEPDAAFAAARNAHRAVHQCARDRDTVASELASTLIVAVARGDRVGIAHIGDGGVVGDTKLEGLAVLSAPFRGRYANETTVLTSNQWERELAVSSHTGVRGLCLFSDGCQNTCLMLGVEPRPFAPFFAPLFAHSGRRLPGLGVELHRLLASDRFSDASSDDKTMIIGVLDGAGA